MTEKIIKTVKSYKVGRDPDSVVVVIPKELQPKPGMRYLVKQDDKGRLIYEPIREEL